MVIAGAQGGVDVIQPGVPTISIIALCTKINRLTILTQERETNWV